MPVAEALRKYVGGKIMLHTTHGLYTKGKDVLYPAFDMVSCYNDMSELRDKQQHIL